MIDQITYIELSGEQYPIKCDMAALEYIQNQLGSVVEFEKKLNGNVVEIASGDGQTKKIYEPDIKACRVGLYAMLKEGMEIAGREPLSEDEIKNILDIDFFTLSRILSKEFIKCFQSKSKEPKNAKATQKKEKMKA